MFKKRRMTLFEILIGISLIAGSSIMVSSGFSFFVNKRFNFIEKYKLRMFSEGVFYEVLRQEYIQSLGIEWFSFDSQKELNFDLGKRSLEIISGRQKDFILNISFKRGFQLPVSNSSNPWKRGIIVKVSFLNTSNRSVVAYFERLIIFERMITKNNHTRP